MRLYLLILPIAMLIAYSQIIVKLRSSVIDTPSMSVIKRLLQFYTDPVILSAFVAALLASFAWLFVVTKLELTVAFPIYIGVTFMMVTLGGVFFLSESISWLKFAAMVLIFGGIVVGMFADA